VVEAYTAPLDIRLPLGVPHGPLRFLDVQNATNVMLGTPAPDVVISICSASVTHSCYVRCVLAARHKGLLRVAAWPPHT